MKEYGVSLKGTVFRPYIQQHKKLAGL